MIGLSVANLWSHLIKSNMGQEAFIFLLEILQNTIIMFKLGQVNLEVWIVQYVAAYSIVRFLSLKSESRISSTFCAGQGIIVNQESR